MSTYKEFEKKLFSYCRYNNITISSLRTDGIYCVTCDNPNILTPNCVSSPNHIYQVCAGCREVINLHSQQQDTEDEDIEDEEKGDEEKS